MLKERSSGPTVGKPPERSFELFFLASYDLDGFRRFVLSEKFGMVFDVEQRRRAYRERLERAAREKAAQLAEQQDQMYDSLKEQGW